MKPINIFLFLFIILFIIPGCSTFGTGSRQGQSGQTDVQVEFCQNEGGVSSIPYLCNVHWQDGKEKQNVSLSVGLPGGYTVDYKATGVTAFEGQAIRAELEKHLGGLAPEIITNITRGIVGAILVPSTLRSTQSSLVQPLGTNKWAIGRTRTIPAQHLFNPDTGRTRIIPAISYRAVE